jgi:hypothetical protein
LPRVAHRMQAKKTTTITGTTTNGEAISMVKSLNLRLSEVRPPIQVANMRLTAR